MLALSDASGRSLAAAQQPGAAAGAAAAAGGGAALMASAAAAAAAAATAGAAGGAGGAQSLRLPALSRMVEVLLCNLPHIHNLWPIFLTHVLDVLHSGSAQIRAAGIDALDRTLTGSIAARCLMHQQQQQQQQQQPQPPPQQQQQQQQAAASGAAGAAPARAGSSGPGQASRQASLSAAAAAAATGVGGGGGAELAGGSASADGRAADVEHMLLVALESMYKEEREPDVRLGLLRIALHVLQRHGEMLSRCAAVLRPHTQRSAVCTSSQVCAVRAVRAACAVAETHGRMPWACQLVAQGLGAAAAAAGGSAALGGRRHHSSCLSVRRGGVQVRQPGGGRCDARAAHSCRAVRV
jgi:hypothetical protein